MIVRILSCGVNWWGMHSKDLNDPFCFRRKSAYYNSTGLMFGRRRRDLFLYPGVIRFNRTSGFDPEYVERISGKTFHTPGPVLYKGKRTLLFDLPAKGQAPDAYLVTFNHADNGVIEFQKKSWRSKQLEIVAISKFHKRYEAMFLMRPEDWVQSSLGYWHVCRNSHQLRLLEANL